jgi:hypothetical protein
MTDPAWLDALRRDDVVSLQGFVDRAFILTSDLAVSDAPATRGRVVGPWTDDLASETVAMAQRGRRFRCVRVSDGYEDASHVNPAALILQAEDDQSPDMLGLWVSLASDEAAVRALRSIEIDERWIAAPAGAGAEPVR